MESAKDDQGLSSSGHDNDTIKSNGPQESSTSNRDDIPTKPASVEQQGNKLGFYRNYRNPFEESASTGQSSKKASNKNKDPPRPRKQTKDAMAPSFSGRAKLMKSPPAAQTRSLNSGLSYSHLEGNSGHSTSSHTSSGMGKHSAHSVSSAPVDRGAITGRLQRRSWQVKSSDLPPSIRRSTGEKKKQSLKIQPSGAPGEKDELVPDTNLRRKPPRVPASSDTEPEPSTKYSLPPPPPASSRGSYVSPRTKRKEQMAEERNSRISELPINLIRISADDRGLVTTYNSLLKEIASSTQPEVQKALNVLATMRHNGVSPDENTWKLIDLCCEVPAEGSAAALGRGTRSETTERLSLYSDPSSGDVDQSSEYGLRKSWKMDQDLAKLPPAFRSSILAMLEKGGNSLELKRAQDEENHRTKERDTGLMANAAPRTGDETTKPEISQDTPVPIAPNQNETLRHEPLNCGPSVANRKKFWLPKEEVNVVEEVEKLYSAQTAATKTENNRNEIFAAHGVVQYMRPDGRMGTQIRLKSSDDNDSCSVDVAEDIAKIDTSDLESYNELLRTIAGSRLPDRANRAGKVLKTMKANSVAPDVLTRDLLEVCSLIEEPSVHAEEIEVEKVKDTVDEEKHAIPMKKKVRFAEVNSFRIIRRRRSISSIERWDDPLTPPKRITKHLDLAPGRFSSGLRDDRPSIPRRSNSGSSLMSGSSAGTGTISDTEGRQRRSTRGETERFRLPFVDESPDNAASQKGIAVLRMPRRVGSDARNALRPPQRIGGETPTAPQRKTNTDSPPPPPPPDSPVIASPTLGSPVVSTLPLRRRMKRRSSIAGTERRADMPLTPPRRVSAPLEMFLMQSSQKNNKDLETKSMGDILSAPETDEPSNSSLPARLEGSKIPNPSLNKTKSDTKQKVDDQQSRGNPRQSSFISPIARHRQSVSEKWKTINLPDKMRVRALDDTSDPPKTSSKIKASSDEQALLDKPKPEMANTSKQP